jgi:hypothetical protein
LPPSSEEAWSEDAIAALKEAWSRVKDAALNPNDNPRPSLFRLAPTICAQRRGLKDKKQFADMSCFALRKMEADLKLEPESKVNYSINFLLVYFDANAHCGYLTEAEIEAAMDHVCQHHDFAEEI